MFWCDGRNLTPLVLWKNSDLASFHAVFCKEDSETALKSPIFDT